MAQFLKTPQVPNQFATNFINAGRSRQVHDQNQAQGQQNLAVGRQNLQTGAINQKTAQMKQVLAQSGLDERGFSAVANTAFAAGQIQDPQERAAFLSDRLGALRNLRVPEEKLSGLATGDENLLRQIVQTAVAMGVPVGPPQEKRELPTNIKPTASGGFAGINPATGAFENIPSQGVDFAPAEQEGAFDNETKLRGEFSKLSAPFIKQNAAFGRIQASANNPSAAGDLALIFNYMKVLDPGSTVREGEFATAQNAGGVGERVVAKYNSILSGERLSTTQRRDFVDRGIALFEDAQEQHNKIRGHYTELARRNRLNPENVVIDFRSADTGKQVNVGGDQPQDWPPGTVDNGDGTFTVNGIVYGRQQ